MVVLPNDSKDRKYAILGLRIAGDFGISLAAPVIFSVIIAQWISKKYGFGIWITILAFVFAGILSAKIILKKAKKYGKEYQEIDNSNQEE